MQDFILKTIISFKSDERGVTLVEYGIAIALAVTLGAGALTLLGGEIGVAMGAAGTAMPN
jgi:pilus assembly protein Flp/PilA